VDMFHGLTEQWVQVIVQATVSMEHKGSRSDKSFVGMVMLVCEIEGAGDVVKYGGWPDGIVLVLQSWKIWALGVVADL